VTPAGPQADADWLSRSGPPARLVPLMLPRMQMDAVPATSSSYSAGVGKER